MHKIKASPYKTYTMIEDALLPNQTSAGRVKKKPLSALVLENWQYSTEAYTGRGIRSPTSGLCDNLGFARNHNYRQLIFTLIHLKGPIMQK